MSIEAIVNEFSAVAANPKGQLKAYKDAGKKCIGVMPYYAPEELVYAAGMMPFGMWGSNDKTEQRSKEYCATFYCTIAQLDLEMLLDGTMDLLDGVITPTICDTLRPMSQNIRVAMSEKLPCIFLAHPQNRFADWGKQFCLDQYNNVKAGLEKIAGHEIKSEDIAAAIKVYNKSRAARREFVKLASDHCDVIDPIMRSAVLKAAWFMDKAEYTEKLEALNAELKALPAAKWNGVKVVTSGIICDGAKPSCAAKIASSVDAALLGYNMYKCHQEFKGGDGIVMKDIETTIKGIGRLGKDGMRQTNEEIIRLMMS